MALVKCPECGGQISDRVRDDCPHCGYPIRKESDTLASSVLTGKGIENMYMNMVCPNCGGEMEFSTDRKEAHCYYCGSRMIMEISQKEISSGSKPEVAYENALGEASIVEKLMKAASIAYQMKDYQGAENKYSRALEQDPENCDALFWKGMCIGKTQRDNAGVSAMLQHMVYSLKFYEKIGRAEEEIRNRKKSMAIILLDNFNGYKAAVYYAFTLLNDDENYNNRDLRKRIRYACQILKTIIERDAAVETAGGKTVQGNVILDEVQNANERVRSIEYAEETEKKEEKIRKYWEKNRERLNQNIMEIEADVIETSRKLEAVIQKDQQLSAMAADLKPEYRSYSYVLLGKTKTKHKDAYTKLREVVQERAKIWKNISPELEKIENEAEELEDYLKYVTGEDKKNRVQKNIDKVKECEIEQRKQQLQKAISELEKLESSEHDERSSLIAKFVLTAVCCVILAVLVLYLCLNA